MPGLLSDPGESLAPFNPSGVQEPTVYPLRHSFNAPLFRVFVSWSRGNILHVACLKELAEEPMDEEEEGERDEDDGDEGGKVMEVRLGDGEGDISQAQMRRIAYSSVPAFAVLQSKKNSAALLSRITSSSVTTEWWQHVVDYSSQIKDLLGTCEDSPSKVIEERKVVLEPVEQPTNLKAAWHLMEIFYTEKQSQSWLPERLVDWLADYDSLLSMKESTVHAKLLHLQKKLVNVQIVEDHPEYWEGLSSGLAVGWLDIVVKLLRLHGSYQPDQLDNRETENGLVEAVAVLISTMPRLRPSLPVGKLGNCSKTKSDFIKAWDKWRSHLAKLDCSAFWVQCGHRQTRDGLKNLLQIMLGNISNLTTRTYHWMELYISHFLYIRPLTMGLDAMYSLAQKCMQLKPACESNVLLRLLLGVLGDNIEVVVAECSRNFGPWMVVHAIELLTADNNQAEILLHEERHNLGGVSLEELHRLVYAQVLSSHFSTWQIAPTYLASCPKQGLGLLEILLYKQPVQYYKMLLKGLEICRLYELNNISSAIMKIAGMHHWKHGRKACGIFWLQQARDEVRLNRIAQELFDCVGKSISDDNFKQWEGLIELLGSEIGSAGGLDFLHKYRDFKRSLKHVQDAKAGDAARKTVEFLIELMKSPATPQRFWLPLMHDAVKLLNWPDHPLLNVVETNMLLNKLQDLSLARLRPDFCETSSLPSHALSSVRLALGTNLAQAILK